MGCLNRADGVCLSTPEKVEALNRTTGQGPIDQHARPDSPRSAPSSKTFLTLQARTALWGGILTATESDDGRPMFIVTRWALTKAFDSLGEVDSWLTRVGAPAA